MSVQIVVPDRFFHGMSRLHTINGQIRVKSSSDAGDRHIYGQYSAPYWVGKAIRVRRRVPRVLYFVG